MNPPDISYGSSQAASDLADMLTTSAQRRTLASFLQDTNGVFDVLSEMPNRAAGRTLARVWRDNRIDHIAKLKHLVPVQSYVRNLVIARYRSTCKHLL